MALRARLAPVRRVRACRRAPFFAAIEALSREARLKSIPFWRPSRSRSACCRRSHTPAPCQSRRRRQQVMPEPQPISRGSNSHGVPERSTNRIPVSAARSDVRGRPPFNLAPSGGSSGAISAQRPSGRSGLAISAQRAKPGFVRRSKRAWMPRDDVAWVYPASNYGRNLPRAFGRRSYLAQQAAQLLLQ
jgi:hypothetical protein